MIGSTSLEVYISLFNINTTNHKFELSTDTFDQFSFTELKDELEEILDTSKITSEHLQVEKTGPCIISAYKKVETEKRQTAGYYMLLMGYARCIFKDFESYLRIVVGLDEDDIQSTLKQIISKFATYELSPAIYTSKDISEVVHTMGDHEGTLQLDDDDITMKTKLILTLFGGNVGKYDLLKDLFLKRYWGLHFIGIISLLMQFMLILQRSILLMKVQKKNNKIHLKSDVFHGSEMSG